MFYMFLTLTVVFIKIQNKYFISKYQLKDSLLKENINIIHKNYSQYREKVYHTETFKAVEHTVNKALGKKYWA